MGEVSTTLLADHALQQHLPAIADAVTEERYAQNRKWGLQRHPTLDKVLVSTGADAYRHCQEFEVPDAIRAKYICEVAATRGFLTWPHIAVEELSEAIEAAVLHGEHSPQLLEELIQLAAVVFAWVESVEATTQENGVTP